VKNEYLKNGSVVFIGYYDEIDVDVKNDNRLRIYPGMYSEIHIPIQNRKKTIGVLSFDKMHQRITPTFQVVHPMKIAALLLANIIILNMEKEKGGEEKSSSQTTFLDLHKLQEIRTLQNMVSIKNKLISTVSHELRTPLTGIIGLTQALRMSGISLTEKEKDTFLGIIENEGKRLAALIRDLLDMSVTEMDGMRLSLSNFSLNELISEVILLIDNPFGEKEIAAVLKDDVILNADKDRIKQVLIILLDNALKHGGNFCTVSTSMEKKVKHVVVSVTDNGPGILVTDQKRVFDSFYTTGSIKRNQPKSTGLGLAIAKKIIESHGGTIWVESVPGNGCTFLFSLEINENRNTAG
jgi:signal transduction histidine kinase